MKCEKFLKLNSYGKLFETSLKISQFLEHVLIIYFKDKIEFRFVYFMCFQFYNGKIKKSTT